jgi:N-acyl homoserine lactone hydrolase
MKKILLFLLLVLVAGIGALAMTFSEQRLPVPADFRVEVPLAYAPATMKVSALRAGKMYSRAALAYRGGRFGDERVFGMGSILVQHPKGTLLFDAGFGGNVDAHFRTTPWLMQATSRYEKEPTVADQLKAAGISPQRLTAVVLTHAHWDHVSGLEDLRGVPVWINQRELDFVNSGHPATALARELGTRDYRVYRFSDGPYLGFASSYDVFGDGSVVLVPAPGHTPGSIVAFIALASGQRYALIGDLAWQTEGIALPAEKPWLARRLVDDDPAAVRDLLVRLHQLQAAMPNLLIVPAHDRRVWDTLPPAA